MASPPDDAPKLVVWLDTDGEADELHARVTENGTTYEQVDTNLAMLLQNEQYVRQIEQSALNLISLYRQALAAEQAEVEAVEDGAGGDERVDELEV